MENIEIDAGHVIDALTREVAALTRRAVLAEAHAEALAAKLAQTKGEDK